ncbi:hypothetical protein C4552_00995 [Candidatus Parcubacteria bacterium]|nr:MAG: hypothetical protein C4552_00995 [Candidatus Parcubacteria bacterium]
MSGLFGRLFGFGHERVRPFIAVDLGSNTGIRSLLWREERGERVMLQRQRIELPRREHPADLIPLMDAYLRRLLFQYVRKSGRMPAETLVGLGGHFTISEVHTLKRERPRPEAALSGTEAHAMLNEFVAAQNLRQIGGDSYTLAHVMPFRIHIDGYPVTALSERTAGHRVEVHLFATYVLAAFWDRLAKLKSVLGGIQLQFVSNTAVTAAFVIDHLRAKDAIVVRVGAPVTEVTVIAEGMIVASGSFDRGADSFTAAIAQATGRSHAEAELLKRQIGALNLPDGVRLAAEGAIAAAFEAWLADLVQFFKKTITTPLPESLYLVGGGARLSIIGTALAKRPWFQELTFRDRLDVTVLAADALPLGFRRKASPLAGPDEVTLAALVAHTARQKSS